jgi:hypothetical protein
MPETRNFDLALITSIERKNNAHQHGATHVSFKFKEQPNGDIVREYQDNGDGKFDAKRLMSPASTSAGGASVFAMGVKWDRIAGDPVNEYPFLDSFKEEGSDSYVTFEGPFSETPNMWNRLQCELGPTRPFTENSSKGAYARTLIRRSQLSKTVLDAKNHNTGFLNTIGQNTVEILKIRYDQSTFDKLGFTVTVENKDGQEVFRSVSTPLDPWKSIERVANESQDICDRFPDSVVPIKCSNNTNVTITWYRVQQKKKLQGFNHYGHGSHALERSVFFQVDSGLGYQTIDDVETLEACGKAAGSTGDYMGSYAFVKISTSVKDENGYPDHKYLPKLKSLKVGFDDNDPIIAEVKKFLSDPSKRAKGWCGKPADVKNAPKYSSVGVDNSEVQTVTIPHVSEEGFVTDSSSERSQSPVDVMATSTNTLIMPSWKCDIDKKMICSTNSEGKHSICYNDKSRLHSDVGDLCKLATRVSCMWVQNNLNQDNCEVTWKTKSKKRADEVKGMIQKYSDAFPYLKHVKVV